MLYATPVLKQHEPDPKTRPNAVRASSAAGRAGASASHRAAPASDPAAGAGAPGKQLLTAWGSPYGAPWGETPSSLAPGWSWLFPGEVGQVHQPAHGLAVYAAGSPIPCKSRKFGNYQHGSGGRAHACSGGAGTAGAQRALRKWLFLIQNSARAGDVLKPQEERGDSRLHCPSAGVPNSPSWPRHTRAGYLGQVEQQFSCKPQAAPRPREISSCPRAQLVLCFMSETLSAEHGSSQLGGRTWPPSCSSPADVTEPVRGTGTEPAKVTIALAETISHCCRSSAWRSGAPSFAAEGAMGSPILAWMLALSWDSKRVDCSLLPAQVWWKVGEERGIGWVRVVVSKHARREKRSKSFGCFCLLSPPSQQERSAEKAARSQQGRSSTPLNHSVLPSPPSSTQNPPTTPPAGAAHGEVALVPPGSHWPLFL